MTRTFGTKKQREQLRRWIRRNYGPRCPEYEPGCGLCFAWLAFDYLFTEKEELTFNHKHARWERTPQ